MGANESRQEQTEKEIAERYVDSCRYELMKQDLRKLATTPCSMVLNSGLAICFEASGDNLGSLTYRTVMGTEELSLSAKKGYPVGPDGKRLKPCCACPETKRARDECIMEKGEEYCGELIEAHKACMRSLGFSI